MHSHDEPSRSSTILKCSIKHSTPFCIHQEVDWSKKNHRSIYKWENIFCSGVGHSQLCLTEHFIAVRFWYMSLISSSVTLSFLLRLSYLLIIAAQVLLQLLCSGNGIDWRTLSSRTNFRQESAFCKSITESFLCMYATFLNVSTS